MAHVMEAVYFPFTIPLGDLSMVIIGKIKKSVSGGLSKRSQELPTGSLLNRLKARFKPRLYLSENQYSINKTRRIKLVAGNGYSYQLYIHKLVRSRCTRTTQC